MAARWSNPSGGLGINRFRVWPLGTDSYTHDDLAANWDTNDGIIGVPSSGTWPPSTGIDGGIYKEVALLNDERTPIGAVISWFRPTGATPIPTGWHAADGTALDSAHHDFPGGGTITLPDLRNRFILGADAADVNGAAAAAVGDVTIDTASGAPGPQASGGSNKIVQTTSQMPVHNHTFIGNVLNAHTHSFTGNSLGSHDHHTISYNGNTRIQATHGLSGYGTSYAINDMGGFFGASRIDDWNDNLRTSAVANGTPSGTNSLVSAGTPSGSISSVGSGSPMDNRPHWYGLIFICKVKYSTTI